MAGLYIRELIMRADSRRILVVAHGGLVEQWRDELFEKFGFQFHVFSSALEAATPTSNPFEDLDHLIVRLDQMARNLELQEKLLATSWDLLIFDEAHKLAAHFFGSKLEKTGRFLLAEKLGARTRHLLLLTATPHSGKEEDFQLFLSLLDSDRFYDKSRSGSDGVHKVDASDLMRRMVKEEMLRFDGTHLFPERKAYTANYKLSDIESALYETVTSYVKTEMGKADALKGLRRGSVGFALTALQRRLASSPEAIFQSLKRRKERLENRLREERLLSRGQQFTTQVLAAPPEDDDDLTAEEQEELEEKLVDTATAGEGMNLQNANLMVNYDLPWNPNRLAEESRSSRVVDVSAQKCGWDITSYAPAVDGKSPESRHIEVKGRIQGATTVTVTRNEIFESWNQGSKYHLAIGLVGEDDFTDSPHYVPHPFKEEPGWGVSSVNYDLKALLERATHGAPDFLT